MPLDHGMSHATAADFSGYDRSPWIVENVEEIEFWWHECSAKRPWYTCGYCTQRYQAESKAGAIRWWRAHDCATLEEAEAAAIVYDLTDRAAA